MLSYIYQEAAICTAAPATAMKVTLPCLEQWLAGHFIRSALGKPLWFCWQQQ